MTALNEQLYTDVKTFARAMLASRDLDPIYDVLRALYYALDLAGETALWFTALYLAYYNLPSALVAFRAVPEPGYIPDRLLSLPIAVERRNLLGGRISRHIADYLAYWRLYGSQAKFITRGWAVDPWQNFLRFWETAQRPWGNGRWAAFKWADLLKNVHGLLISAPDMRLADCTGPVEGLQRLYDTTTEDVLALNYLGNNLRDRLAYDGLLLDWEQLETVLCNFKSLAKGKYYVGHDIDELQERIDHAPYLDRGDRRLLLEMRRRALPLVYLGECCGWQGIQRDRMGAYAERGAILVRP